MEDRSVAVVAVDGAVRRNVARSYRRDVDGMRGIAVAIVVLFHAFQTWMPGGFLGVDVFFVISGFLISGIILDQLARRAFTFTDFYARRIRRIFPALVLLLAAALVGGWLVLLPFEYEALGKHATASAGFLINFVLLGEQGYFDRATAFKPLMHLWSLAVEEQFYLVWPLLLVLCVSLRRSVRGLMLVVFASSFAAWWWLTASGRSDLSFYLPVTRFWELMLGALLAQAGDAGEVLGRAATEIGWGVAMLFVLAAAAWHTDGPRAWLWTVGVVVAATVAIAAGERSRLARRVGGCAPLVYVGLVSYPLYLLHWPLLAVANMVRSSSTQAAAAETLIAPRSVRLTLIAVAVALAAATYEVVERPIRRTGGPRGRRVAVALASLVAATAVAGYAVWRSGGFPGRVDPEDQAALDRAPVGVAARLSGDNGGAAEASPRVAVFGDSHAAQLFYGMETLGANHIGLFTRGTCLPLRGVHTFRRPTVVQLAETDCQPWVDRALDELRDSPAVRTVVVTAFYNQYLDGRVPITVDGHAGLAPADVFRRAARDTVHELVSRGKQVVLVVDVPEFVEPCLPPRPHFFRSQASCAIAADAEAAASAASRSTMTDLADGVRVFLFDARSAFCRDGRCLAKSGRTYLYNADGNHLTSAGIGLLMESLRQSRAWAAIAPLVGPDPRS